MREFYLQKMTAVAAPVLNAAAQGSLKRIMAVEQAANAEREPYAAFEAVSRLLCGISAWFEVPIDDTDERTLRDKFLTQAMLAIDSLTDKNSDDYVDYGALGQPFSQILVDTAFLSQALLRAPNTLLNKLPVKTRTNLLLLLEAVRGITPNCNNWILFSIENELLYHRLTGKCNQGMIKNYFKLIESWYLGDGWYSDGPVFTMDYYNSLVIYPMLLDLCDEMPGLLPLGMPEAIIKRAQRHAEILERMIAADGSYFTVGRSLAYRCGVFHLLAQLAWQNRLPDSLPPESVREALGSVINKTLNASSFRGDGFLNIGVCGSQPLMGEAYICTGSLYMAAAVFLPLGIANDSRFWTGEAKSSSWQRIWSGGDIEKDIALEKR
jgi:hypothetical protein